MEEYAADLLAECTNLEATGVVDDNVNYKVRHITDRINC